MWTRIYMSRAVIHKTLKTHMWVHTTQPHKQSQTSQTLEQTDTPQPQLSHTYTHIYTHRLIKREM